MSVLWTIVPTQLVFDGFERHAPVTQEIRQGGVTMLVTQVEGGWGRLERLISPNPQDYLRPEWQPGTLIPLHEQPPG